ncbi:hypothetical protein EVAR_40767_1 [Eumeta japonica]|uniref:Uncharacterized protein n=1 Tax=Eumeta variegata TaxID=151549 RepID=A0A4C1X6A7_EUMVA|nr:hypothetical protein EVAR_40767_1 [Eumeta japonica]
MIRRSPTIFSKDAPCNPPPTFNTSMTFFHYEFSSNESVNTRESIFNPMDAAFHHHLGIRDDTRFHSFRLMYRNRPRAGSTSRRPVSVLPLVVYDGLHTKTETARPAHFGNFHSATSMASYRGAAPATLKLFFIARIETPCETSTATQRLQIPDFVEKYPSFIYWTSRVGSATGGSLKTSTNEARAATVGLSHEQIASSTRTILCLSICSVHMQPEVAGERLSFCLYVCAR